MNYKRWLILMSPQGFEESLTPDEIKEGWHFCYEFDGLLRNNKDEDFKCDCVKEEKNEKD